MKDQCVCITGSTHGIGFGIAEAFAKKGAKQGLAELRAKQDAEA